MPDSEAPSPAINGDAKGSEGLTADQAAARLFAHSAKATTQKPATPQAAAETSPAQADQPTDDAAAEAQPASAETTTTADAPETETTTTDESTTAPETEDAGDDVLSPATLGDEKLRAKIQKRIDKERFLRGELERKLAEAESKLKTRTTADAPATTTQTSNTATNVPLSAPNSPLANINDLGALKNHTQVAKDAMRWAEDTLDNPRAWKARTDVNSETGEETTVRVTTVGKDVYDEAQVRAIRREAKVTLEDHIPARKEFLEARTQAQKTTHEMYPFMKDKSTPEYQQAQSMLRDPWVQMRPDADWIVATQIMGIKALEAQRTAAAKPAVAAKPKPAAAKPGSDQAAVPASGSPSRVAPEAGQRMARSAERDKLSAKGGITAAEAAAFLERTATTRKPG